MKGVRQKGESIKEPLFAAFKYAPITTAEIKRFLSVYKTILAGNRQSFKFKNMRQVFVTRCNALYNPRHWVLPCVIPDSLLGN